MKDIIKIPEPIVVLIICIVIGLLTGCVLYGKNNYYTPPITNNDLAEQDCIKNGGLPIRDSWDGDFTGCYFIGTKKTQMFNNDSGGGPI